MTRPMLATRTKSGAASDEQGEIADQQHHEHDGAGDGVDDQGGGEQLSRA